MHDRQTACPVSIATPEPRATWTYNVQAMQGRMLAAVDRYIADKLHPLKLDGEPVPVYGPDAFRALGEKVTPCFSIELTECMEDKRLSRPHLTRFVPSDDLTSITVPERWGYLFKAELLGTEFGPFHIEEGVNDILKVRVGTENAWGEVHTFSFLPGIWESRVLARAINAMAPNVKAWPLNGRICLETFFANIDLEILADDRSAHETFGIPLGVRSHLMRTGPASYRVEPVPIPVILTYQIGQHATTKAHAHALLRYSANIIRDGHWPTINGQNPIFWHHQVENMDELANPSFLTLFRYRVEQVWLPALSFYEVSSILQAAIDYEGRIDLRAISH
jgi:hypothetical protein